MLAGQTSKISATNDATVAREYGIPAVVGVKDATRLLRDGEMIEVDGATGDVRRLGNSGSRADGVQSRQAARAQSLPGSL
jgi:pyruvate,water dikinase